MRALALLLLPPLAALACVYALAAVTGGPAPARPGATHSFVWKKQVFTSKQQFSAWLERRNVTYADWRARHPGASLPWEDQSRRLEGIALLAAALAGILAFLIRERRAVGAFVGRVSLALRERRRPEEPRRPPADAGGGFSLREAVAVYGVRSRPRAEERNGSERPALALVDPPPTDSPAAAEPEPEAVAVAVNEAPRRAAEPPRRRRRRTAPRARGAPVERPAEPTRPEDAPLAVEPEPETPAVAPPVAAAEAEPAKEPAVEGPPRRRRRATRRSPKAAPSAKSRPAEVVDSGLTNPGDSAQPEEQTATENAPIAAEPEPEPPVVAPPDAADRTETEPEITVEAPPSRRRRAMRRSKAAARSVDSTAAEQAAPPEPESAPAVLGEADPTDQAEGAQPDDEPLASAESAARDDPVPSELDAAIEEPVRPNGGSASPESALAASEEPDRAVESHPENGRPVDDLRIQVPEPESPQPESPVVSPVLPSFGVPGSSPPPTWEVREVVCEIAYWHGFVSGQFYARLWGDTQLSAVATSPKFRSRSETPEQTEECLAALGALTDFLIAEGWTPIGRGRAWYAKRFTTHVAV